MFFNVFCICLTIVLCAFVFMICWFKYIALKTEEIRRKYPIHLDNVPHSQKNIWNKK